MKTFERAALMKTFEVNRLTGVGGGAQLLTATVKLFLKKPTEGPQAKIQAVLQMATQETDNPDLRDRAYVYWRLLSTDPEAAKVKPTPSTATGQPWGLAYRVPPPSQRLLVAGATLATNLPRLQQLFRPAECRFVERVE